MTWLTPGLAAAAAAVALPTLLILYFLKLRRRDVEVSSTLLWKKAIQDLQANAPFQRLRRNILLLLQLLALGAVLLALAQPETTADLTGGNRHIILLDRSASMGTLDGPEGRTRLEEAQRRALEQIDAMREGGVFGTARADEAMVIAFDTSAEVVQPFTSDKGALRRAIDGVGHTHAPGRLGEAFRLAQAHVPTRLYSDERTGELIDTGLPVGPPSTVHLFTDGRLPDSAEVVPFPDDEVIYHRMGEDDTRNVGITGLRAERAYDRPERLTVFVGLQSNDPEPRPVDVELLVDGSPAAIRRTTMPGADTTPGAGASPTVGGVVFTLDHAPGAILTVRIRHDGRPDALAMDDEGWLIVSPARRTVAALVTTGSFYLEDAIAGLPLARLDVLSPEEFGARLADGRAAAYDAVILDRWLPEPRDLETLPRGRWLVLGAVPGGGMGLEDLGPDESGAAVLTWNRRHPVLRNVGLEGLLIAEHRETRPAEGSGAVVLAETQGGPAIVELGGPHFRALVIPFDPAASTWPFDVGFVVFLASAIDYLSRDGTPDDGTSRTIRPGTVLSDRLPAGAGSVEVLLPRPGPRGEMSASLTPGADGRVVYGPIRHAGIHRVRWAGEAGPADTTDGGRGVRHFAANLLDPFESDVRPAPDLVLGSRVVDAQDGAYRATRRFWPWLLLAALGVIMFEWFVYNRKVHL